jgi:hypothetical protein
MNKTAMTLSFQRHARIFESLFGLNVNLGKSYLCN